LLIIKKKDNVKLSIHFSDGRINLSINEEEFIKILKKQFDIVPKSQAWYDFAMGTGNNLYPVNIKVTDTTTHVDVLSINKCNLK